MARDETTRRGGLLEKDLKKTHTHCGQLLTNLCPDT